jgi:hypothetical protein
MLTIIRKNQQVLMTLVVVLTIVSFIWLYNRTNLTQVGTNDVVSLYGKVIQRAEIDREARAYQLALALGLTDFVKDLGGLGSSEEVSLSNFILNLFVSRHEAKELGVRPTDEAVVKAIKMLEPLQTDGVFDPAKYAAFVQEQLTPRGFTELQMEDVVRDSLSVHALHRIVTSPVAISEEEIRAAARVFQPVTAQVLRFDREKFLNNAAVTPAEVSAFYEKNKGALKKAETRSLSYIVLELPASEQKLSGKESTSALQKLADKAVEVGKEIRAGVEKGEGFGKLAEKASLHPVKALSVQRDGSVDGKASGLPEVVVEGAFRLQKSGEVTDIIQDGNAFYIVTVDEVSPICQLELAEVTDKILTLLKSEKAGKAASEAAAKSLDQIRAAMKEGKAFADVVKQVGVQTQPLTNITPADSKNPQEAQALAMATLSLKEGELGQLQPAPWGAFAVYLEKRAPLTDAQWKEHQQELSKKLLSRSEELIFQEWLNQSRGAAQIKMLGKQSPGGA